MMEIKHIKKGTPDAIKAEELITSLFPESEQIPMFFLLSRAKKDFIDFLAFHDSEFVGFAYMVTNGDLTFINYLAVNKNVQSKGYGSKILAEIKALYPKNRLFLNLEVLDENAENNLQRIKRRAFYERNGYKDTGIITTVNGNTLDTMILGDTVSPEEMHTLFKKFTGAVVGFFVKYKLSKTDKL
ncbi:MAG: GNAT family N-acetyltransferase [Defluviitaleaceae bacterium]|nr:GNAT family N-acetyltransferase [Defluviitaleaceae bacterium]